MHILISTFIAALIGAIYSLAVYCLKPDKFWDWLNVLISSGLSFFLAVLCGMYLFKLQGTARDLAERKALQNLLSAEFSDLLRILGDSSRMEITLPSGNKRKILIALVHPLAIDKSALSSLFSKLESENLLHLARKLKMLNFKSEYLMSTIQAGADEQFILHAADNLDETRIAIISDLGHLALQLKLSINNNYPD
ncbi:hypothetical protein GWQ29_17470 [Aeromonas sp. 2HA2]|uniref:hypothetical protein n=1 Tax=Aeromonas sp. 2HA2 TaxID=2699194 RepID=UPI0023DDCE0D|nr:hypothetical protein [Aeromonas sp. 2HA2]MDF2411188.1 hypothetical protein [Aeromonas sp. 2HA2]